MRQGIDEHTIERPFNGWVPNQILIWMVDQRAANGDHARTPFRLDHYDLSEYSVRVNGNEVSGTVVDADLVSVYSESYRAFDSDYFIPYKNYGAGSFLIVANCTHQSDENSINIDKKGNMSIVLRFRNELPKNVKVYVMGTIDSTITLDNDRTVTTNYQF